MIEMRLRETIMAGGYPARLYLEPERAAIARAYHRLFTWRGIAPVPGRKLYRFATRLGPAESSIDVSPHMAYVYFRYLEVARVAADDLPSDPRYRTGALNRYSGKLNCHVAADEEKTSLPEHAMEMVEGFDAILADLDARPLGGKERPVAVATGQHSHPSP